MGKKRNIPTGQKFGDWTVVSEAAPQGDRRYLTCRCVCENVVDVQLSNLTSGKSVRCQRCGSAAVGPQLKLAVEAGTVFGLWTVVREAPPRRHLRHFLCRCQCGTEKEVYIGNLRNGNSGSCRSCSSRQAHTGARVATGIFDDDAVRQHWLGVHANMMRRCHDPSDSNFIHYGGRGIVVDASWHDRLVFLAYIKTLPNHENLSLQLDRIENNGNYAPGNVRMATRQDNMRNRQTTRWVEHNGERMCGSEFWERFAPRFHQVYVLTMLKDGIEPAEIIRRHTKKLNKLGA